MSNWVDGRTNGWMHGRMDELVGSWFNEWMNEYMHTKQKCKYDSSLYFRLIHISFFQAARVESTASVCT